MVHVEGSSSIQSFDWSEDNGLTVTFQSGRSYNYPDVSEDVFGILEDAATSGGSVGSLFSNLIRNGGYDYSEVSD